MLFLAAGCANLPVLALPWGEAEYVVLSGRLQRTDQRMFLSQRGVFAVSANGEVFVVSVIDLMVEDLCVGPSDGAARNDRV